MAERLANLCLSDESTKCFPPLPTCVILIRWRYLIDTTTDAYLNLYISVTTLELCFPNTLGHNAGNDIMLP